MGIRDAGTQYQDLGLELIRHITCGNNGNVSRVQGRGNFCPGFPVVNHGDASPGSVQEAADSQPAAAGPQDKDLLTLGVPGLPVDGTARASGSPGQIRGRNGEDCFGCRQHYNTLKVDKLSNARRMPMIQNRITTRLSGQPRSSKW